MDRDIAFTLLLEHIIRPALVERRFNDVSLALNVVAALTIMTGRAWTLYRPVQGVNEWLVLEWSVS